MMRITFLIIFKLSDVMLSVIMPCAALLFLVMLILSSYLVKLSAVILSVIVLGGNFLLCILS